MKKKLIVIVCVVSLITNVILGFALYKKANDKSIFENGFLSEISFAVQRFEEYKEQPSDSGYTVGVAHLYSAWTMLANVDEKEWTYKQADDFHELWNIAALYPDLFTENLDEIIEILKQIKVDNDFNDSNALLKLSEFNTAIRYDAK